MSVRLWIAIAGAVPLAISGTLLALWLTGDAELIRIASWRGKTNTCIAMLLVATALLLRTSERRGAVRASHALASAALAIGALTMFQYVAGVDLGIDELVAHDWPFPESAQHPNRMSPNAALSFVLAGAAILLASARPGLAAIGQIVALVLLAIDAVALIGYLYDAAFLYRQGAFIRISPYSALCFVSLAAGSLALRPEIGPAHWLRGGGIGGYLARRLLLPVVAIPIVLAWVRVEGEQRGWWTESAGVALEVLLYISVFAALVLYVARSLDAIDARRKRTERELREARDEARAANRAKDEFLAMLGHELRNPLAPIASALTLMRIRDPRSHRERDVIERQVKHMTRLVDDLLDVSRIAGGKIELSRTPFEVGELVREALELVRPLIDKHGHTVDVDVEPGLAIDGDRDRLVQVVSNLLNNAAKYTPPGGSIEVAAAGTGDDVVLRVTDTGAGISPELLPRVFDLFVQGERTLDRTTGGLGLGLAIVQSLVTLHGGTVKVESGGEGKGATFTVTLPAPATTAPAEQAPAAPHTPPTNARRVLIVDDNQDAAELLAEAFELAGHTVRVAHDGKRALEVAEEFEPECVMLDIGLPLLDGYEVARRLRERDGDRRRTLVAMTGYGQEDDVQRAFDAGFDRHLVKPVSLNQTLQIIADTPAVPSNPAT
jgi:signal transduction histidine kinase/ActR/RegA family two-component response regulator